MSMVFTIGWWISFLAWVVFCFCSFKTDDPSKKVFYLNMEFLMLIPIIIFCFLIVRGQ